MINIALPIGIDDYAIASSKYYVDKTLIIKEIIDKFIGNSLLITRPRRFGKSLMLSMIDHYFSILNDSSSLFKDKLITKESNIYSQEMNNRPVIHLNLKNLLVDNPSSLINQVIDMIANVFLKYSFILDSDKISDVDKQKFYDIMHSTSNEPSYYVQSLYFLSKLLFNYYNKKVVILIDEYDTPIEDAYQKNFYDDVISFFKKMYSALLKSNEYMYFSIVTGVLEIAKESIFSDLNNLLVYSVVDEELSQYFGFTEKEVKTMLDDFEIKTNIEEVNNWYGGYGIKDMNIFNPWSIINFVNKKRFLPYWVNSGSKDAISNLIKSIPDSLNMLNEFVNNKYLSFAFNNSISYKDIRNDKNTLFSYLVQSGYLVALIDNNINYNLFVPNNEIRLVFENEIVKRNTYDSSFDLVRKLSKAIVQKEVDEISFLLKEYIIDSFSYYDLTKEKDYQIMLVTLMAVLFTTHIVKSEVNNKNGRCDIMILPKNDRNLGIIIEVKKYKGILVKERLLDYAEKALEQIKKQEYYNELERLKIKKILLYGFSFDDRKNSIASCELNN